MDREGLAVGQGIEDHSARVGSAVGFEEQFVMLDAALEFLVKEPLLAGDCEHGSRAQGPRQILGD